MPSSAQARGQIRTGKKTGIWLALFVALVLHSIILLVPITRQMPPLDDVHEPIELQLTTFHPQPPAVQAPADEPDQPHPVPASEAATELMPEPLQNIAEAQPDSDSLLLRTTHRMRVLDRDLEKMSEQQKSRLTNAILSRQFIAEESAADILFGRPYGHRTSELKTGFHYPARQNMIAMLDQPMSELPFEYTPGLIRFAYDPGIKGDLQRFWDVITPEFGWRTKNGTEFKCIWVLVIAGCGWK
jgi:hypothetical protein